MNKARKAHVSWWASKVSEQATEYANAADPSGKPTNLVANKLDAISRLAKEIQSDLAVRESAEGPPEFAGKLRGENVKPPFEKFIVSVSREDCNIFVVNVSAPNLLEEYLRGDSLHEIKAQDKLERIIAQRILFINAAIQEKLARETELKK